MLEAAFELMNPPTLELRLTCISAAQLPIWAAESSTAVVSKVHSAVPPGNPSTHFCNGYFEVYLFLIEGIRSCYNNHETSLTGDMLISYGR